MAPEDTYWAMKDEAAKRGLPPARLGQLAKLCQNYERATEILKAALKAKIPSTYLGAVISRMKDEQKTPLEAMRANEPEIVFTARLRGWPIRKTVLGNGKPGWWICGVLYNEKGNDVGG